VCCREGICEVPKGFIILLEVLSAAKERKYEVFVANYTDVYILYCIIIKPNLLTFK